MPANAIAKTLAAKRMDGGPYAGYLYSPNSSGIYVPPGGSGIAWTIHNARSSLEPVPAGQGYRQITPTVGARVILVSPNGSDANVGYRTVDNNNVNNLNLLIDPAGIACQSLLRAAQLMRNNSADIILLDADDPDHYYVPDWDRFVLSGKKGISFAQPVSLGWFSPNNLVATHGQRPKIQAWVTGNQGFYLQDNVNTENWLVQSVEIVDQRAVLGHSANTPFQAIIDNILADVYTEQQEGSVYPHSQFNIFGKTLNLHFEDVVWHCVEPIPQGNDTTNYGDNFRLYRNIWRGGNYFPTSYKHQLNRPSNMYMAKQANFKLHKSFLRYGGWHPAIRGASANQYNHCLYFAQVNPWGATTQVFDNFIIEPSSHGMQLRSSGEANNNYIDRSAYSVGLGSTIGSPTNNTGDQNQTFVDTYDLSFKAINNVICNGLVMMRGHPAVNPCQGGVCTPGTGAILIQAISDQWEYIVSGNVINKALRGQTHADWANYQFYGYGDISNDSGTINGWTLYPEVVQLSNNKSYKWNTDTQNQGNFDDPEFKDLQSWVENIAGVAFGSMSSDAVFTHYESRPIMGTNSALEIENCNNWVRAGFADA